MEKTLSQLGTKVLIVMGSDSDLLIMKQAEAFLKEMGVPCEMEIISAHRTPRSTATLAIEARQNGIEVIIAGAGMAAHLPGVIASYTTLPVVGVPLTSKASPLLGLDALLSMVQMPSGVPVLTVGIDNAKNAAIEACSILSIKYPELVETLDNFREKMALDVQEKSNKLKKEKIRKEVN